MFEFRPNTYIYDLLDGPHSNNQYFLINQAVEQFNSARWDAFFEIVRNFILHRRNWLFNLDLIPARQVRVQHYAGLRTVRLDQIFGTLGRNTDFDHQFHPLNDRIRDRWINIALARWQNQPLEPVDLIQVGDGYFVRDGHHRLSVSHSFGETAIEAEVTVWEIAGCLPWETCPVSIALPQTD